MTFRARPVATRPGRSPQSGDRRNFYINVGFVIAIVAAVLILVAALVATWYDGHLAPAARVGGTTITKDQFAARYKVESFRLDYAEARLRTLVNLGLLTSAQETQQLQFLDSTRSQLVTITLERLIDAAIQDRLAAEMSPAITISEADIDARMRDEATIHEQRHAWVIEVAPDRDVGAREPTEAQKTAARQKASQALADLRAGKAWEEVAIAVSTSEFGAEYGDLGFLSQSVDYDQAYLDAIFTIPLNTLTDVLEGEDGIFRIGRATEAGGEQVDGTFDARMEEADVNREDYRLAVRADVLRERLEERVVADMSKAAPQRQVQAIFIQESGVPASAKAVKVRHILYAPKDDTSGAGTLPADDPAWKAAEDEARATYQKLRLDISQFDSIARSESDETSARTTGGRLPYFDETSAIDPAFAAAIFGDHKPGDLLEPVKSSFGWHVIQIRHGPTDATWAAELKKQLDAGARFADLARDNSESAESVNGGDLGWISRGELGKEVEDLIFRTPVGSVSDPTEVAGQGIYLVKVVAEEVRSPTPAQLAIYRESGFSTWYTPRKEGFKPERLLVGA
jgi:parvulin-like peptidyl-prolyl isomerase